MKFIYDDDQTLLGHIKDCGEFKPPFPSYNNPFEYSPTIHPFSAPTMHPFNTPKSTSTIPITPKSTSTIPIPITPKSTSTYQHPFYKESTTEPTDVSTTTTKPTYNEIIRECMSYIYI